MYVFMYDSHFEAEEKRRKQELEKKNTIIRNKH